MSGPKSSAERFSLNWRFQIDEAYQRGEIPDWAWRDLVAAWTERVSLRAEVEKKERALWYAVGQSDVKYRIALMYADSHREAPLPTAPKEVLSP